MLANWLPEKKLYYTGRHEWIRFQEKEAYAGIRHSRTTGVKKIKKIAFIKLYGFKKKGDIFATIEMDFQQIDVHMPVDGTITQVNNMHSLVNEDLLLTNPKKEGWLVKMSIGQPIQKDGLLLQE